MVAAGLHHHIDDAAAAAAVLSRKAVGLQLELLDGIRRGEGHHYIDHVGALHGIHRAVDQNFASVTAAAVDGKGDRIVERVARRRTRQYSGRELRELIGVACVKRQIQNPAVVDHVADGAALLFDQRSGGGHLNTLRQLAQRQRQVHSQSIVNAQFHSGPDELAEARCFGLNTIESGHQGRESVVALRIRHGIGDGIAALLARCDTRACDGGARRISNGAGDGSRVDLRA